MVLGARDTDQNMVTQCPQGMHFGQNKMVSLTTLEIHVYKYEVGTEALMIFWGEVGSWGWSLGKIT